MNKKNFWRDVKSFLWTVFSVFYVVYPVIVIIEKTENVNASLLEIIGSVLIVAVPVYFLMVREIQYHYGEQDADP